MCVHVCVYVRVYVCVCMCVAVRTIHTPLYLCSINHLCLLLTGLQCPPAPVLTTHSYSIVVSDVEDMPDSLASRVL